MNSKIKNELNELIEAQVISHDTASKIKAYYKSKQQASPNRLFTVFGVFGAALVGLGIILILAHNWDDFSRPVKTIFAFLPLIIGQIAVGIAIIKHKGVVWKESSGVFLFFAIGSSMALVSQIYNIPGELSSYLLSWTLLALPLIYLLKSNALGVLHIAFMTYYAVVHGYFYDAIGTPWLYLLLFLVVLPFYFRLLKDNHDSNITSMLGWLLSLSAIIVLGTFVNDHGILGYIMYVILFGCLYNIGKLPFFNDWSLRRNGYLVLGSLGTVYMLLLASFKWIWSTVLNDKIFFFSQEAYVSIVLFLFALAVLIYGHVKKQTIGSNIFQYVFILFTVFFFVGLVNTVVPVLLINVLLLILGIVTIKVGADKLHFGILNYGLLIITTLIVCRFFDTDMSFVLRGLLFVGVGLGFFLANYFMLKKQRTLKG